MKHIKAFETVILEPNFKVGDIVVCLRDTDTKRLVKGNKYLVTKIYMSDDEFMCKVKDLDKEAIAKKLIDGSYYCTRFATELDVDTKDFNL